MQPNGPKHSPIYDLLVIDDDPDILRIVTQAIADSGITAHTVQSLAEARKVLGRGAYRVVLSDQFLPDGLGTEFCAELHAAKCESIPMLMTGMVDVNIAIQAINTGHVFKVVTKPLDIFTLVQSIRRAIRQHKEDHDKERWATELLDLNAHLKREAQRMEESLEDASLRLNSGQAALETERQNNRQLFEELQNSYLRTITSLMAAIHARDEYTRDHSDRVYLYCSLIADVLEAGESVRTSLRYASMLHDIGKIGIPDAILLKSGPLTDSEREVMKTHPELSAAILEPLHYLSRVRQIARQHHERFDGHGYPDGLAGTDICLEARILSVADAYDAMRSDRPYRSALSREEAEARLRADAGTQFCPVCTQALLVGLNKYGEDGGPLGAGEPHGAARASSWRVTSLNSTSTLLNSLKL